MLLVSYHACRRLMQENLPLRRIHTVSSGGLGLTVIRDQVSQKARGNALNDNCVMTVPQDEPMH